MNTARLNPYPAAAERVTKRYGDNTILNELDLHIPSGQFVAVVAGGGKCCACWQVWKTKRRRAAGGRDAGGNPDDTRMMFQDARLLPWKTVIDNVGLGLKALARRRPAGVGQRRT